VVALHTVDWGVDDFYGGAMPLDDTVTDALNGGLTRVGVADDAAFADVLAAGFELRLDENDSGALPGVAFGAEGSEDGGQDESGGDEGDVHCEKRKSKSSAARRMTIFICLREEFAGSEEAGVGAFAEGDSGIVAEFLGNLAIAGVDGKDGSCAALEHAVGEAAGGGTDVDAGEAGKIDGPVGESVLEFEAAAADVLEVGAQETNSGCGGDGGAWLVDALLIDENASGEDEGLSAFAGGGVAEVDEKLVETDLFVALFCGVHDFRDSREICR